MLPCVSHSHSRKLPNGLGPWVPLVVVALAAACAIGALNGYMTRPGPIADAPGALPEDLATPGAVTVVVAAHPRCPCTRATAESLADALGERPGVRLFVLAWTPSPAPADWDAVGVTHPLVDRAGATILPDPAGARAHALGARTSGHTLVYDAEGHLRFSGGVTPARGMTGPSTGLAALHDVLAGRTSPSAHAPVFGCAFAPDLQGDAP